MSRVASWPFHPYFFALYYLFKTSYYYLDLVTVSLMERAFALFFAGAMVLHVLCWLGWRNVRAAGLMASVLIALLYLLPVTSSEMTGLLSPRPAAIAIVLMLLVVLVTGVVVIRHLAAQWENLSGILNAVGLGLLVIPIYSLVNAQFPTLPESAQIEASRYPALEAQVRPGAAAPDIYHIVLDGYSRADILQEVYDFDNRAFIRDLEDLGFFVADQATGNYTQTLMSMSAVFSMRYLDQEFEEAAAAARRNGDAAFDKTDFRLALRSLINDNVLTRLLDALGYYRVAVDTPYPPILISSSDEILSAANRPFCAFNVFETLLYQLFPLELICRSVGASDTPQSWVRDQTHFAFAQDSLDGLDRPVFVFQHVLLPHAPFLFGADGSAVDQALDPKDRDDPNIKIYHATGYLNQVEFANGEVLKQVTELIRKQGRPMIIVIQSDHGGDLRFDTESQEDSCLRERFAPLLAVYSTDGRLQEAMSKDLSLVNIYRVILNTYFGTTLERLESRHFFAKWSTPAILSPVDNADLEHPCSTPLEVRLQGKLDALAKPRPQ